MKRCTRCIMDDESDSSISFDKNGVCNYCTDALKKVNTTTYFPGEEGQKKLEALISKIKADGKNSKYDCVMGLSGGLDSSYLAYLGHKWDLRILAVHIDDGYDTDISKSNIAKLVSACNIEMRTIFPDAQQFNALTKAYMLAGVPNLAIPQDNVLFAFLYDIIRKEKIKYFLSGGNFALECILQQGNTHSSLDLINIKDIQKQFGTEPVNRLKFISSYRKYWDMKVSGLQTVRPLDYIDYNRERAFKELYDFCGFEYYGRKHLENKLTAFIQLYWLPRKFHVDKRTSHLSSMIVSGQMTRDEALKELSEPMYDANQMLEYIDLIKHNMNITDDEFDSIMSSPVRNHEDYKVDKLSALLHKIVK